MVTAWRSVLMYSWFYFWLSVLRRRASELHVRKPLLDGLRGYRAQELLSDLSRESRNYAIEILPQTLQRTGPEQTTKCRAHFANDFSVFAIEPARGSSFSR